MTADINDTITNVNNHPNSPEASAKEKKKKSKIFIITLNLQLVLHVLACNKIVLEFQEPEKGNSVNLVTKDFLSYAALPDGREAQSRSVPSWS